MKKPAAALLTISLALAIAIQVVPAKVGDRSSTNNWGTWTQVKKLGY